MTHTLEFEVIHVCTRCLEECHLAELEAGHTPCCQAEFTKWGLRLRTEFLEWYEEVQEMLEPHFEELQVVRQHVRAMHPDSKKRRKTYAKPSDVWPGRLSSATTKKGMRKDLRVSKKEPGGVKPRAKSVDIMSSDQEFLWQVDIIMQGKLEHQVNGKDRADARRKARSWLRGRGTSITVADQVLEEQNKTIINFV